jgi:hypothetical protein
MIIILLEILLYLAIVLISFYAIDFIIKLILV